MSLKRTLLKTQDDLVGAYLRNALSGTRRILGCQLLFYGSNEYPVRAKAGLSITLDFGCRRRGAECDFFASLRVCFFIDESYASHRGAVCAVQH